MESRSWKEVPRTERSEISRAVLDGRAVADQRQAANAAAYAEWLLAWPTESRWFRRLAVVFYVGVSLLWSVLLGFRTWGVVLAAVCLAGTALGLRTLSERHAHLEAARDANRVLARAVGATADIAFPPIASAFKLRRRSVVALGTIAVGLAVLGGAGTLIASHHKKPSKAARAANAACVREHNELIALRSAKISPVAAAERQLAAEEQVVKDIQAGVPVVERPRALDLMLGWQNTRIIALEDMVKAFRRADRTLLFSSASNSRVAADRFAGQAVLLGAYVCARD